MEKAVTKKEKNLPAMTMDEWGTRQTFTQNDIVIPKILPLQFMSEKVKNKEGQYGELRDTLNNDLFGDLTTPMEFIPFYVSKKWIEYDVVTNKAGAKKREFKRVVAIDHTNDNLPYVDESQGVERDRCVEVYVLLPKHIEEGNSFPYVLSFRRTSLKAGNKIITQILRNERMNLAPAAATMLLSGKTVQNDDGEFVVLDVKTGRQTTPEEVRDCFNWYKLVASGTTKVDESDFKEEGKTREVKQDDVDASEY
jgi:hypothetical protein